MDSLQIGWSMGLVLVGMLVGWAIAMQHHNRATPVPNAPPVDWAPCLTANPSFSRLQESDKLFRQLTEHLNCVLWIFDPVAKRHVYVSPAYETLFGRTCESLYADSYTFIEVVHPDDRSALLVALQDEQTHGINIDLEFRIVRSDQSIRWVHGRTYSVNNETGEIYRFVGIAEDITERKQAELALEAREKNYRYLLDHLHAGVVVHAPDTSILMSNATACNILGLTFDQMLGKTAIDPAWHFMKEDGSPMPPALFPVNQVIATQQPIQNYVMGIYRPELGSPIWAMVNAYPEFDWNQQLQHVVVTFINITELQNAKEQLRHSALHDPLTGLPNRVLLMERLERTLHYSRRYPDYQFAVLFLDLDRFKAINDSFGHFIGDQLLIHLAQQLQNHVRETDTVCRLGGDEFIILLDRIADQTEALQVSQRIQTALKMPVRLAGHEVQATVSIGIALGHPGYQSGEEILRDADQAMYRAKATGRAHHEVFVL